MITLAKRIKQLRKEKGLTQEEFGKIFGIVKSTVSLYENNKSTPDDEIKKKIAEHFNVSLDFLMGNSDIKNPYNEDYKEDLNISKSLDRMKKQLTTSDSLMFDGQPATEEQVQAILNAIEMGEAYAKQRAKEKFTPKKYRK